MLARSAILVLGVIVIFESAYFLIMDAPHYESLIEYSTDSGWGVRPWLNFPVIQSTLIIYGVILLLVFLSRSKRMGMLLLVPALGAAITFATAFFLQRDRARVLFYGYPQGWLAEIHGPPFKELAASINIRGILTIPFLIDMAFWTALSGAVILLSFTVLKLVKS